MDISEMRNNRPKLPKRAVITGGMPYGNKELHFGHIGGVFVQADAFSRFLRDRIGAENVIFVSGTDGYGSPILVGYRQQVESGAFSGSLTDFIRRNHDRQREAFDKYLIDLNLFAASSFGPAKPIHEEVSAQFFNTLYQNGHLRKITTAQFYDTERETFLNGRQVVGRCPIQGCKSTKAYADECELGHQYMPTELIAPKSTLTGNTPEMRDVTNWYFDLPAFRALLSEWTEQLRETPGFRNFIITTVEEFLKPPVIYVKNEEREVYESLKDSMPPHELLTEEKKPSFTLVFDKLPQRDEACALLTSRGVRYRTGKTLVPFRLTGNIEWGVPAPDCEGTEGLTFWVWPESLWAPISFTQTYLEQIGHSREEWADWWCDKDAMIYQFIGSDNISFYGPAEMGMWMGMQGAHPTSTPKEGQLTLPYLVANNHILFLGNKASSSGDIKPPMALDLLEYYTPEQLRAHFLGLGLGLKSVSFQPTPLNPSADQNAADPVLKEGNLLTNVFNRIARSCFYTAQTHFDGTLPFGEVSPHILEEAEEAILTYERHMCAHEFHSVMSLLDSYIRGVNKYWVANMKKADAEEDGVLRRQTLVDAFYSLKVMTVLVHPVAPKGTEMIRDYLNVKGDFFSWDNIFEPIYSLLENPDNHRLKLLEPKVDFFEKHPSQYK